MFQFGFERKCEEIIEIKVEAYGEGEGEGMRGNIRRCRSKQLEGYLPAYLKKVEDEVDES